MKLYGDNILVKELQDDFIIDGFIQKYDDVNPYMFVKVANISEDIKHNSLDIAEISIGDILVIKRIDKIPFIDGNYFVSSKSVIASIPSDEYSSMIVKE